MVKADRRVLCLHMMLTILLFGDKQYEGDDYIN